MSDCKSMVLKLQVLGSGWVGMGGSGLIETKKNLPSQQPAPPPKNEALFSDPVTGGFMYEKRQKECLKKIIIATIGIGMTVAKPKRGNPERHKSLLSSPGVCGNERIGKERTAAFLREGAGAESTVRPHPLLPL